MKLLQAFGQFAAAGAAQPDFVHLATVSGTATTEFNFQNVFTADYDFYQIVHNISSDSGNIGILGRLLSGATPNTSALYDRYAYRNLNGSAALLNAASNTSWVAGVPDDDESDITVEYIANPLQATYTTSHSLVSRQSGTSGAFQSYNLYQVHRVASSFDGYQISAASNISGTASMYGWRV